MLMFSIVFLLLVVFLSKLFLIHCITHVAGARVTPMVITSGLFPHLHPPHHGDHLVPPPWPASPLPGELVTRHSQGHAGVRHHAPGVGSGVVTVPERDLNNTWLNSQQNLMSTVAKELLISLISLVQLFYVVNWFTSEVTTRKNWRTVFLVSFKLSWGVLKTDVSFIKKNV